MFRQVLDQVVRPTLAGFGERLVAFGPNLVAMLMILAAGLLIAGAARVLVRVALARLGFDRFAARVGFGEVLRKGGLQRAPSALLALVLAWTVLGAFVLLAIGALDLEFAMDLLSRGFLYLPQVLIAGAILILAALVAAFLRRTVLIAAVNAGLTSGRLLAAGVHTSVLIVGAAMALEHLGVGRQVILLSFAILFGGVVLALALAFGLAGRDLARELLERGFRPQIGPPPRDDGIRHV